MKTQARLIKGFVFLALLASIMGPRWSPAPDYRIPEPPQFSLEPASPPPPQPSQPEPPVTAPEAQPEITPSAPASPTPSPAPAPVPSHPNYKYTALLSNSTPLYASEPFLNRLAVPAGLGSISNANTNAPVIAVIDTGFALNHDSLKTRWATDPSEMGATSVGSALNCSNQGLSLDKRCNNYDNNNDGYPSNWRGWNFVNNNNDPSAGTSNPGSNTVTHGTLTASLAAALNPNAKIMPLQALDDSGVGYTDTVAAAVHYAADHGANIISLSLGSTYDDVYLRSEIDYAISKNVLVVAAAGNSGCDCLSYPAAYPEVLSVGASDSTDHLASFSSYGANLDVIAPGTAGDLCGAVWTQSNQTSGYSCNYAGTSFATPIVASLASLLLTQDPAASPSDLIRFITQNADKPSAMGPGSRTLQYGYGRVNAVRSILAASIAPPQGQLINKTTGSLTSTDLTTGPFFDSTCQGDPGAYCDIQITSLDGSITKDLGTQQLDTSGGANFVWNAASLGLTPGQWRIKSILTNLGQTSVSQISNVTISP